MPKPERLKKLVWAVDPFEADGAVRQGVISTARMFAEQYQVDVYPAYVLCPRDFNISDEMISPWLSQYLPAAESALPDIVKVAEIERTGQPRVLVNRTGSRRTGIQLLADYCEEVGADLVLLGTHGRTRLSRLIMGSFAEALILYGDVPSMVIGSHKVPSRIRSILFSTDLGDHSRYLYEHMLARAREFGADVWILHVLPGSIEPAFQSGLYLLGGSWVPVHSYFSRTAFEHRKQIEAWVRWSEKRGVSSTPILIEGGGSVSEHIRDQCERIGADVIAMAARSGPISSTLLGSIARQVIRRAPAPVWILHPPRRAKSERMAA